MSDPDKESAAANLVASVVIPTLIFIGCTITYCVGWIIISQLDKRDSAQQKEINERIEIWVAKNHLKFLRENLNYVAPMTQHENIRMMKFMRIPGNRAILQKS